VAILTRVAATHSAARAVAVSIMPTSRTNIARSARPENTTTTTTTTTATKDAKAAQLDTTRTKRNNMGASNVIMASIKTKGVRAVARTARRARKRKAKHKPGATIAHLDITRAHRVSQVVTRFRKDTRPTRTLPPRARTPAQLDNTRTRKEQQAARAAPTVSSRQDPLNNLVRRVLAEKCRYTLITSQTASASQLRLDLLNIWGATATMALVISDMAQNNMAIPLRKRVAISAREFSTWPCRTVGGAAATITTAHPDIAENQIRSATLSVMERVAVGAIRCILIHGIRLRLHRPVLIWGATMTMAVVISNMAQKDMAMVQTIRLLMRIVVVLRALAINMWLCRTVAGAAATMTGPMAKSRMVIAAQPEWVAAGAMRCIRIQGTGCSLDVIEVNRSHGCSLEPCRI